MKNIILIGMPSCGKSTCGVVLAKTINKGFVDTDLLIQQREGKKLQEIINTHGNEYFRKVEEEVLCDYDGRDSVVATGGSAVYYERAMAHLKENGVIVYIRVSLETVLRRLNNIKTRGVTLEKGMTLSDLYEERVPLYEKYADVIVDGDQCTIEELIEQMIERI